MTVATLPKDHAWREAGPIRRYRHRRGLTQVEFAEQVGCSVSQLIEWEKGGYAPTLRKIEELAGKMGRTSAGLVQALQDWMAERPE